MAGITEADVEREALDLLGGLGYAVLAGPDIAPGGMFQERSAFSEVVLVGRLRDAVQRLNPELPADACEEVVGKVLRRESPLLVLDNKRFHELLVEGVPVEYQGDDGQMEYPKARLISFDEPQLNDWVAVNQYTVVENGHTRRPDIVVFVNGLPLGLFELKDLGNAATTVKDAYQQLCTYREQVPSLMQLNEVLVVSDYMTARMGSLTSDIERFMPWRTIEGEEPPAGVVAELPVLIKGVFERSRFLQLIKHFVAFEDDGAEVSKKLAAYHQFHAVNKAVEETVRAASATGDKRAGVVWHTQGSGKSLTMVFYAGRLIAHPAMENPTLVVLTDRNDLDDQLHGTFSRCSRLLRQTPVQAQDRGELRRLLNVASGGVVFTTIQKFLPEEKGDRYPELSSRRNIVVIADEAHRSQYDFVDGFARHIRDALPNASFIGFTGTPIELEDKSTKAIFGEYIDVYDIERSVTDGATVRIFYESRMAKIELNETEKPHIDPEFEELTEGEEEAGKQKLRTKWAAIEALVGTEKRLSLVAKDLVQHFETKLQAIDGKAMVVCMSRRICVDLYDQLVALHPDWEGADDTTGAIKVVMTGSASDRAGWQKHIRPKKAREALANRFKDPNDPLKIVIVRDMWLTGFDAPCLHTMYVDKPMRGHALMQAIARVNRVFRDKDGGLVVDYLGLADQLQQALASYTAGGGKGRATLDQAEAVAAMLEKHEVVTAMFHGFDYKPALAGPKQLLAMFPKAADHILAQENGKTRFVNAVSDLSRSFALAVPHQRALAIRDELAFFQEMRSWMVKPTLRKLQHDADMETAVRQLVSRAVAPAGVMDVFAMAGLDKPDISSLSDGLLAEVKDMPQKNVAVELLHKLLNDEIQHRSKSELVRSRTFSVMLEEAIRRYTNRAIQAAEVIEQLIQLAKDLRESRRRGEELGLTGYEMAFYEALEVNDSAVKVLGDDTLRDIARELVRQVRASVSIDWAKKESTRAKLRNMVRAILTKYGYPPDKQKMAVDLVLEQAAELSDVWAAEPSVTEMGLRYTALLAKRGSGEMTLADQRELRRLEAELMELGELQANEPTPTLMAAEEPAE